MAPEHEPLLARILIAEDDEADVELVTRAFSKSKLANEVYIVRDGEEALEFLRREGRYKSAPGIDIFLLDINMPKKSGQEVLLELRKDPTLRRLPVVMLTSSEADEDILKAYENGANSYIRKPVGFEELRQIVNRLEEYWFAVVKRPPRRV